MERSVPSLVEQALNAVGQRTGLTIGVVNTGTSGYSPTLYYLLLKRRLLDFQPDLLVVNVDMTDVFDDSLYRDTLVRDADGDPAACPPDHKLLGAYERTASGLERVPLPQRALRFVASHSRFVAVLSEFIRRASSSGRLAPGPARPALFGWDFEPWSADTRAQVANSFEMLRSIFRLAARRGIKVAVTGVPHREQLSGQWSSRPFQALAALCAEAGVPFLDSLAHLRKDLGKRDPGSLYIPNDMHFNEAGYALWAQAQLGWLRDADNALLPAVLLAQ